MDYSLLISVILLSVSARFACAQGPAEKVDIFAAGYVGRLTIEISTENLTRLRHAPRQYVSATVKEGAMTYTNVAVHLKGSIGSFRSIDQNPSLTLNFSKFAPGQTFHGFKKFHLNNSVQDATYLHEKISRDLFLAAEVPTPRAAHAVLQLNNSRPRLCVLVEGANKQFLKRYFKNGSGNLYDGGLNRDVTSRLRLNSAEVPANRSDLRALARAAAEPDLDKRRAALERTLDVDRFLSFLAMEIMIAHWDGYALNVNNYRIYHDPDSARMVFIPHGMDQVFHNIGMSPTPDMRGLVAQSVMEIPELRTRYLDRMRSLLTNVFVVERVTNDVVQTAARIRPFLGDVNSERGLRYDQLWAGFNRAVIRRHLFLERALGVRDNSPALVRASAVVFDPESNASLPAWSPAVHLGQPKLQMNEAEHLLCMVMEGNCVASWRTRVTLPPGHYRFAGRVRATGLQVDPNNSKAGVALRVSRGAARHQLRTSADWTTLRSDFDLENSQTVELVCEVRAAEGEVCFDRDSLKLSRR